MSLIYLALPFAKKRDLPTVIRRSLSLSRLHIQPYRLRSTPHRILRHKTYRETSSHKCLSQCTISIKYPAVLNAKWHNPSSDHTTIKPVSVLFFNAFKKTDYFNILHLFLICFCHRNTSEAHLQLFCVIFTLYRRNSMYTACMPGCRSISAGHPVCDNAVL